MITLLRNIIRPRVERACVARSGVGKNFDFTSIARYCSTCKGSSIISKGIRDIRWDVGSDVFIEGDNGENRFVGSVESVK